MELLLVAVVSAAVGAGVTWFVMTHRHTRHVVASATGEDQALDLRLGREFQEGREAGRKEELGKFTLIYEPFVETVEEYMGLKKRSTLGYDMRIYYAGFPIGDGTRHITHQSIEYDEKRIDALLNNEVAATISEIIQLASTRGLTAKVLPRSAVGRKSRKTADKG